MKKNILLSLLLVFFLQLNINIFASQNLPVAFLIQAKGNVEYSKDGKSWKKIRRNKFIFNGYRIRTDKDSKCKLVEQENNTAKTLYPNSEIIFQDKKINIIKGKLSNPENVGNLLSGLARKYDSAQKYTTIRRSVKKEKAKKIKLSTVKEINLSDDYPDIVWENLGSEFSYRLELNNQVFPVNSSKDKYIRYTLKGIKPGEYDFSVQVIEYNKIVYTSRKRTLRWLTELECLKIKEQLNSIQKIDTDNAFLLGTFFEEKQLLVPAMDQYLKYFEKNPDEYEMRIILIKIYSDLKLKSLKKEEVEKYMQQ